MIRHINLALTIFAIVAFAGIYVLKFSIENTAAEKRALERAIVEQEAELSLLRADWAILIQPGHVDPIVRRHQDALELAEVSPRQFGTFSDLPMRPARPDNRALDVLFDAIQSGVDPAAALIGELN